MNMIVLNSARTISLLLLGFVTCYLTVTTSFAQDLPSSEELQEGWDNVNKAIEDMGKQISDSSQKYANAVDAFEIDDVDLSGVPMYQTVVDSRPKAGSIFQVYLGDRMILERQGMIADCIIPRFAYEDSIMGGRGLYKANVPICKSSPKDKYYSPPYINSYAPNGSAAIQKVKLKTDRKGIMEICQTSMGMSAYCRKDIKPEEIEIGPAFVSIENSFQRTIEYSGKSGGQLKFQYSEFTDGMAREAFNREFEVDLTEGNIAAYKGAIIEIIEATNANITYKVLRHFQ